jgi:hypothetical protein
MYVNIKFIIYNFYTKNKNRIKIKKKYIYK